MREPPKRLDYIEGAIELSIDGHPIITKDEWDLVDQVWAYLVNAVQRVARATTRRCRSPTRRST